MLYDICKKGVNMGYIVKSIYDIIEQSKRDTSKIKTTPAKTYTNISFYNLSYIRVKDGPKVKYISIPRHLDYMLSHYKLPATEANRWYKIYLNNYNNISNLSALILEIFDYCRAKTVGETFGCCSRYVDCSDAKACIYENERWSKGCIYRKNIINKRIIYGRNATLR